MTSAHIHGHTRPHPGRSRVVRRPGGASRLPRLIEPEELNLFTDRLDDAREYESTLRDFMLVHDQTVPADGFDS